MRRARLDELVREIHARIDSEIAKDRERINMLKVSASNALSDARSASLNAQEALGLIAQLRREIQDQRDRRKTNVAELDNEYRRARVILSGNLGTGPVKLSAPVLVLGRTKDEYGNPLWLVLHPGPGNSPYLAECVRFE